MLVLAATLGLLFLPCESPLEYQKNSVEATVCPDTFFVRQGPEVPEGWKPAPVVVKQVAKPKPVKKRRYLRRRRDR